MININVQMSVTNHSFTAHLASNGCDFKVNLTVDDMLIPTAYKEEVS